MGNQDKQIHTAGMKSGLTDASFSISASSVLLAATFSVFSLIYKDISDHFEFWRST